jgi:uncharacterized protein YrrD
MDTKMQFQQNADVLAANGKRIGQIERVVLNPETRAITHIVVRKTSLFKKKEKVVPIDLVATTAEDQIALRDSAGDLESLPAFEEQHLIGADDNAQSSEFASASRPSVPPPAIYGPVLAGMSPRPAPAGERFVIQTEQNIPAGTVAMKEGAKVMTAEGKHVGNVERVLADVAADRATYLLVSTGLLTREKKLIPITWVSTLAEDEVHLRVKRDSVEQLADTRTLK